MELLQRNGFVVVTGRGLRRRIGQQFTAGDDRLLAELDEERDRIACRTRLFLRSGAAVSALEKLVLDTHDA
ncbi:hypothetical protein [Amycolatopsis circi]|uniref:hypothetical protein n=1 Tax=Amycolatopsis circi TaxID=871959 RepID=UPI000E21FDF0|nr:hypothetical protein [Amycolatopsis circi]